jgi:hypothetical protein
MRAAACERRAVAVVERRVEFLVQLRKSKYVRCGI